MTVSDDIADAYEKATAPPPPPVPPTQQPRRSEADWERDRLARVEAKENQTALREKHVPNFFLSEFGKDFVLSQVRRVSEKLISDFSSLRQGKTDREGCLQNI